MRKYTKPKLIIDTDPGHDDALAILMTVLSNQFDILAITTVAGNATIEKVTRNAKAILNLIDADIPIFSGMSQPLKRKLITAVVHGESGLAGFSTTDTAFSLSSNAPQKLVEMVNKYPNEITILALGPLSNIARAVTLDSSFSTKIKQLVIMGGAINVPGNKNRVAEFNFFVDPEAADVIFKSDMPKVVVPLDACNQVVLQVDDFKQLQDNRLRSVLLPMMQHFATGLASDEGSEGVLVYDALAAYFLIQPKAFTLQKMDVVIETKGEHTFGMSVAEKRPNKVEKTNVDVVVDIGDEVFKKEFFEILDN